MNYKSAIGFCEDPYCERHINYCFVGALREGPVPSVSCDHCAKPLRVKHQRVVRDTGGPVYREVRVEWKYDVKKDIYRNVAVVIDSSLPPTAGTLVVEEPLFRTEKPALGLAERLLASVNLWGERYSSAEFVLDWGDSSNTLPAKLQELAMAIERRENNRRQLEERS